MTSTSAGSSRSDASGGTGRQALTGARRRRSIGAAAGAAIGAATGNAGNGAAIGAASGGIGGGAYKGISAEDDYQDAYRACMERAATTSSTASARQPRACRQARGSTRARCSWLRGQCEGVDRALDLAFVRAGEPGRGEQQS